MTKYTFHVSGTHCAACKILIEDVLSEQDFIKNAEVNLKKELISIETDSGKNARDIANLLKFCTYFRYKKNGCKGLLFITSHVFYSPNFFGYLPKLGD